MSVVEYALIVSLGLNVLFAVLVFRFAAQQTNALDRSHERTVEYTGDLLNRLMVRDWGEYNALTDTYTLTTPDEVSLEMIPTLGPDRGGFGSRLGLAAYGSEDEIKPEEEMP